MFFKVYAKTTKVYANGTPLSVFVDTDADSYEVENLNEDIAIFNKEQSRVEALASGEASFTFTARKSETQDGQNVVVENTYNFSVVCIDKVKKRLNIEPKISMLVKGKKQRLIIDSDYPHIEIISSNPNVIHISKRTLTALDVGNSRISVRGYGEDLLDSFVSFEVVVANEAETINPPEIEDNVFKYDDELPAILKDGAIVYKTGNFENSPVIEYKFNGETKRYDCIGVKLQQYGNNEEPYSIAFLTEEGTVDDVMYKYRDKLIEMGVEDIIFDKIKETIRKDMRDYLSNTRFIVNHSGIKEVGKPKWLGILHNDTVGIGRRINTNGLEEEWGSFVNSLNVHNLSNVRAGKFRANLVNYTLPMNHLSNFDPVTLLFNEVEPYKSFRRMAWKHEEFVTGKFSELRKRIYYKNAETDAMHEEGYKTADIFHSRGLEYLPNYQDYDWFNVVKKSYYIDAWVWIDNQRYRLVAIGCEPFIVDMADYVDDLDRVNPAMELEYFKEEKQQFGWFPYKVEGSKIHANLHPAFYDFYDLNNELITDSALEFYKDGRTYPDTENDELTEDSIVMDYRYFGSFLNKRNSDMNYRPHLEGYYNGDYLSYNSYANSFYKFGNLPNKGINFQFTDHHMVHLFEVMHKIERGAFSVPPIQNSKFITLSFYQNLNTFVMGNMTTPFSYRGVQVRYENAISKVANSGNRIYAEFPASNMKAWTLQYKPENLLSTLAYVYPSGGELIPGNVIITKALDVAKAPYLNGTTTNEGFGVDLRFYTLNQCFFSQYFLYGFCVSTPSLASAHSIFAFHTCI